MWIIFSKATCVFLSASVSYVTYHFISVLLTPPLNFLSARLTPFISHPSQPHPLGLQHHLTGLPQAPDLPWAPSPRLCCAVPPGLFLKISLGSALLSGSLVASSSSLASWRSSPSTSHPAPPAAPQGSRVPLSPCPRQTVPNAIPPTRYAPPTLHLKSLLSAKTVLLPEPSPVASPGEILWFALQAPHASQGCHHNCT